MERLAVISNQDANAPSPDAVIGALVDGAFSGAAKTSLQKDLASVVQTEIAERLMLLVVNSDATTEVQAAALAGVHEVQTALKKTAEQDPALQRLDHEIILFLADPHQNTPKLKPSGAPAGPPV